MTTHPITLSKSDFLLYCDAPRHLWAKKHNQISQQSSPFAQLLGEQGYVVEELGKEYLDQVLLAANPGWQLTWQGTYTDGAFQSRVDGLIYKPESGLVDLVEIKSSTGVDKEHIYDVTFQALIWLTSSAWIMSISSTSTRTTRSLPRSTLDSYLFWKMFLKRLNR